MEAVRADKWLWAIRAFKTRGEAAKACQAGRVKRLGKKIKPSTTIRVGDRLEIPAKEANFIRELEVLELIDMRVAASVAVTCYKEWTDPERAEAARQIAREDRQFRREGSQGRMTKRDRRRWEDGKRGFFE